MVKKWPIMAQNQRITKETLFPQSQNNQENSRNLSQVGRSGSPGPPEDFNTSGYPPSSHGPGSANLERMRKRSSGRRKVSPGYTGPQQARLQKSFSTDSSLHHMVPSSPIHPPEPGNNRHKYEDHLIIYQRMPSVFNPLTGMKIMKVRTARAGTVHRLNRSPSQG